MSQGLDEETIDGENIVQILESMKLRAEKNSDEKEKKNIEEKLKEIHSLPFSREILNGSLKITKLRFGNLVKCAVTSVYLGVELKGLDDQLSWKIGVDKKMFFRFYQKMDGGDTEDGKDGKDGKDEYFLKSSLKSSVKKEDVILYNILSVKYLRGNKSSLSVRFLIMDLEEIVKVGNLRLLRHVINLLIPCGFNLKKIASIIYPVDPNLYQVAANNCQYDCLRYMYDISWESTGKIYDCELHEAVKKGNLNCVKFLQKFTGGNHDCFYLSVECGDLELVKFFFDLYPVEKMDLCCFQAAREGFLDILTFLHENGFPWCKDVVIVAAEKNRVDCLKYAIENGCPYDQDSVVRSVIKGSIDCLKYLYDLFEKKSVEEKEKKINWGWIASLAVENRNLNCLEFLYGKCPIYPDLTITAARNGDLKCLQFLYEKSCGVREKSCIWDERVTSTAFHSGAYGCFGFATSKGCPADSRLIDAFQCYLSSGMFETLK